MKTSIQGYFSKFFHLNQEVDLALLSLPAAQKFLDKIGIKASQDFFDQEKSNYLKSCDEAISILLNYFSSADSQQRIWSGLAIQRLCLGLDLEGSFSELSLSSHKGRAYGRALFLNGGVTQLRDRVNYSISKLTNISKDFIEQDQGGENLAESSFNNLKTLDLELELRISYNLFYLMLFHNSETQSQLQMLCDTFELRYLRIEEMCYNSIKMSLEVPVTPIKKILIFFFIYLTLILGNDQNNPEEDRSGSGLYGKPTSQILYSKELGDYYTKNPPRWFLLDHSKIEQFYRRQMNKQNPIPQIIVVCTLRVLLTTCPNTRRQSTGVDIAREWSSSLYKLFQHKAQMAGFTSSGYEHAYLLGRKTSSKKAAAAAGDEAKKFLEKYELSQIIDDSEEEKIAEDSKPVISCNDPFADLTAKEFQSQYEFEEQRHKLIVAGVIGDLFLLLLRKFKRNCLMQFVYLIQLIVDANGVLVLLKFLNQDFSLFKEAPKLPLLFAEFGTELVMSELQMFAVKGLLKLMRRTCEFQAERIKSFLVQYKAATIMKKIVAKFGNSELVRRLASKISKIQVKFMQKKWRQTNMKSISNVYKEVELKALDDWLSWGDEWKASGQMANELTQDEIRHLHSDFNFRNYWQFHDREDSTTPAETRSQLLDKQPLEIGFLKDYKQWLEVEVWSYYD